MVWGELVKNGILKNNRRLGKHSKIKLVDKIDEYKANCIKKYQSWIYI